MRKTIKKLISLICLLILSCWFTHSNPLALEGKKLYIKKFCVFCHGRGGISKAPNYPNLVGQNKQYLIDQYKDIVLKQRTSKLTVLMTENPIAGNITDDEIAAIAYYLFRIR